MRVVEECAQDDLRHVVPPSRKLVQHDVILWDRGAIPVGRLLGVIERAGRQGQVRNAPPVEVRMHTTVRGGAALVVGLNGHSGRNAQGGGGRRGGSCR